MEPSGGDYRAEQEREREEARRRYRDRIVEVLTGPLAVPTDLGQAADTLLDTIFVVRPAGGGDPCRCSCHPHLPTSFHDYGDACPCQQPASERGRWLEKWIEEVDAYWASPEGQAEKARQAAAEAELQDWVATIPEMEVTSHGGTFPEQWHGTVEGHSFYFREKREEWRIEIDLQPTGQFYRAYLGADLDDESNFEQREVERGTVIAEGVTGAPGYGETPVERAQFIYRTITGHLVQQTCTVHEAGDLEIPGGHLANYCPACGVRMYSGRPRNWY